MIHSLLTNDLNKDEIIEIITLADNVYCSIQDIDKGVKSFNYGDILIVSNLVNVPDILKSELLLKGVFIREFKGKKTNLKGTLDLDAIIKDYMETTNVTLDDFTNNKGISFEELSEYTKDGGILSQCNKFLYTKLQEFNNIDVRLHKDVDALCINYNITLDELINKLSIKVNKNKEQQVEITTKDSREDDKELKQELKAKYIDVINKYVSRYNTTDAFETICRNLKVNTKDVLNYIEKDLVKESAELYELYKAKNMEILDKKQRNRLDSTKFTIVNEYLKGNNTLTELAEKYGISTTTIYNYINTNLKKNFPSIYNKYKVFAEGNMGKSFNVCNV